MVQTNVILPLIPLYYLEIQFNERRLLMEFRDMFTDTRDKCKHPIVSGTAIIGGIILALFVLATVFFTFWGIIAMILGYNKLSLGITAILGILLAVIIYSSTKKAS